MTTCNTCSRRRGNNTCGGVALIRAIPALDKLKNANEDEQVGIDNIVKIALESPMRQIAENAGVVRTEIVVHRKKWKKRFWTDNARTETYEDMYRGVIDCTK